MKDKYGHDVERCAWCGIPTDIPLKQNLKPYFCSDPCEVLYRKIENTFEMDTFGPLNEGGDECD